MDWFKEPLLSLLIRISGVNVLLNSLCIVQTALLTANLDIRRQTIIKSLEYPPNCSRLTQQDLIIRELEEKRRSWADN